MGQLVADDRLQVLWGETGATEAPSEKKAGAVGKPPSAGRSMEDWRKELRGKDPKVAYELVVADDSVPAYEAFVALFAQPPYNMRARVLLERRYVMRAWATAVAINTAASYQAFLKDYPDSDLAATARKLRERVLNREFGPQPANVAALGPLCPCGPVEPTKQLKRKVEKEEPKPTRRVRRAVPNEEVVQTKRRQEPGIPPEAIIQGIGIGIGIGGALSGGGGGGGHHAPSGGCAGGHC